MTHLDNAPDVPGPLITTGALVLAAFVLLGVLFTLAHLHDVRRARATGEDS